MTSPKPKSRKVAWVVGVVIVTAALASSAPHWPGLYKWVTIDFHESYWPDGSLWTRSEVKRGTGLGHGLYEEYWPNGQMGTKSEWEHGRLVKDRGHWDPEGTPVDFARYIELTERSMQEQGVNVNDPSTWHPKK